MEDLKQRLAAQGVHTLLAQFTDLHGVAKGKLVPLAHLETLLRDGAGFSGPSIAGTGLPRFGPRSEYYGRGDASTACALPWVPGVARVVCDGFVAGKPFDACPRQVLRRQTARLAERGWSLQTGLLATAGMDGQLRLYRLPRAVVLPAIAAHQQADGWLANDDWLVDTQWNWLRLVSADGARRTRWLWPNW